MDKVTHCVMKKAFTFNLSLLPIKTLSNLLIPAANENVSVSLWTFSAINHHILSYYKCVFYRKYSRVKIEIRCY